MTLNQIEELIKNYRVGSYIPLKWKKTITLKDKTTVQKLTTVTGRLGVDYGSLPEVKAREQDPNKEIKPVEWIIKNYVKKSSTGKELLMIYTTKNHKAHSTWLDKDGNEINLNDIIDNLYAKDKPHHTEQEIPVFTVDIANLLIDNI